MTDLLELLFEYRFLVEKRDGLGIELDDDERARAYGLARLLAGDGPLGDVRREMPRLPFPTAAEFTVSGGFGVGQIVNVSGGGLAIATTRPAPEGSRTIVRVADNAKSAEYVFPCRVVWARTGRDRPGMGLHFDGVPTRTSLADMASGVWRRTGALSDAALTLLVA